MEPVVVFVSDFHVGAGGEADHFEARLEFIQLLKGLEAAHEQVELVLLGDFLDLHTIEESVDDKVAAILSAPANRELFRALKDFGAKHAVWYVIGNHEAELCWKPGLRAALEAHHVRFAKDPLTYQRAFSRGGKALRVYAEHGNQFDPHCRYTDFYNPLDTPLSYHMMKDLYNPLLALRRGGGREWLHELEAVRPYEAIPWWVISKYFYFEMNRLLRYVTLPVLLGFVTFKVLPLAVLAYLVFVKKALALSAVTLPILVLLAAFVLVDFSLLFWGALIVLVKRDFRRALRRYGVRRAGPYLETRIQRVADSVLDIVRGRRTPNFPADGPPDLFVYGHFHIAGLETARRNGRLVAAANTGTWTKRIRQVKAHFRLPPVFLAYYNLTYVKVVPDAVGLRAELRRIGRPYPARLTWLERLATWGKRAAPEPIDGDVLLKKATMPYA